METSKTIRAVISDPKFRAVEDYMLEMKKDWLAEIAEKEPKTLEEASINTIRFVAKANAVDEILEALYEYAGSELKEKINKIKDKDYE